MTRVLLTGADGLIGAEVLSDLARRPGVERVDLLLPGGRPAARPLLTFAGLSEERVRPVAGDSRLPRFGLDLEAWEKLGGSVDLGIHCAETRNLSMGLEEARRENARPVEEWIRLLEGSPDLRLAHLSTAFVGGRRRGLLTEFDLDCAQGFRNAYERSKFEAETRLAESAVTGRVTILRPSHVVGHSVTGAAWTLGGGYPVLDALGRGGKLLAADPRARFDLVPVDYVAAATAALAEDPAMAGKTFHLVAGWRRSLPARDLAARVAAARSSRPPRLVPLLFGPAVRALGSVGLGAASANDAGGAFHRDYLRQGCVFDDYQARAVLGPRGIEVPRVESYLPRVLDYASRAVG